VLLPLTFFTTVEYWYTHDYSWKQAQTSHFEVTLVLVCIRTYGLLRVLSLVIQPGVNKESDVAEESQGAAQCSASASINRGTSRWWSQCDIDTAVDDTIHPCRHPSQRA